MLQLVFVHKQTNAVRYLRELEGALKGGVYLFG